MISTHVMVFSSLWFVPTMEGVVVEEGIRIVCEQRLAGSNLAHNNNTGTSQILPATLKFEDPPVLCVVTSGQSPP